MLEINESSGPRQRVLWLSTVAFTIMFAVWLMLGILGLEIKKDAALMLGDAASTMSGDELKSAIQGRFEWLLAVAILSGSLLRLSFGIWADRYGGRNMMVLLLLVSAVPTYGLSHASSYQELLICAALFGLAGNSFSVGIAWNSAWYPSKSKGVALGVIGAGNVGASGTKLLIVLIPSLLTLIPAAGLLGGVIPGGWRVVPVFYSVLLVAMAGAILLLAPKTDRKPGQGRTMFEMLSPLKCLRVWRLSLYYVVVFGAYVALASWLPDYYRTNYFADLSQQDGVRMAALFTALFIFPASLLRPFGGYLSDKYGPRTVMYCVFIGMTIMIVPLCLPASILSLGVTGFTAIMFAVGIGMGIGKASVFKYIPNYFPNDVGAAGGLVGMLGALGGFILPKLFGTLFRTTGVPQSAFIGLLAITLGSLVWLHLIVVRMQAAEKFAQPVAVPEAA
ncbi:MAG: NarK/NasA family nitrate transporter [Gemmataceae bacterium]|nr:NarK/NasA family nitrate transporter [Gemmataceae bacterium]